MNTLDLIVVAIVALSGLFAFVRGFVREALSIAAWIGAAVVTVYCYQTALPYARGFIHSEILAELVAAGTLFIGSLIVFSIAVGVISSQVRESGLGALDRALGLIFGVVRGGVLVCAGYLIMNHFLVPENRPDWIVQARSLPLLAAGAEQIQQLIPHAAFERGSNAALDASRRIDAAARSGQAMDKARDALHDAGDAVGDLIQPKIKPQTAPKPAAGSYKPEEQQKLNNLFEASEAPK